jgi:predicted SnoaL-like aldol condensation-catalyzing enzyme
VSPPTPLQQAFDTLFNMRDYAAVQRFWSPAHIQHSAHIQPGRFSNVGQPADSIVADIVRLDDGLLAEHWDVIQDEATRDESISGLPMFGAASRRGPDGDTHDLGGMPWYPTIPATTTKTTMTGGTN